MAFEVAETWINCRGNYKNCCGRFNKKFKVQFNVVKNKFNLKSSWDVYVAIYSK